MTTSATPWEHRVLTLAMQEPERADPIVPEVDADLLARAYDYCNRLTRTHTRTFYTATRLLPPEKRRAIRALYAFCRVTDDLIDGDASGGAPQALAAWRLQATRPPHALDDPVAIAWADTRARCRIPAYYAQQLVDGVAADLRVSRYATFDELAVYCYGVASTVGLMSIHILGFSGKEAIPYAVKMGVAMQITNILRDVREDWEAGRLYLPQEELNAFGLAEDDIAAGRRDARWRAFVSFQIERNRRLYREAMPGIGLLDPAGRLSVAAAAEMYRAILDEIEAHDGDVFTRRAGLSTLGKLRRLPAIWQQARGARPSPQPAMPAEHPAGADPAERLSLPFKS